MTKTKQHFEGVVEVCCRRVVFCYWDFEQELTPQLEIELALHAEERAKECIVNGYRSGQLNCFYYDNVRIHEEEIRGWWEIEKD